MLLTLPLILFIVMAELSVGAFTVLFVLDWRNGVKRSFLITYALIYLVLTGLTYLFQQGFSPPGLLNTYAQLDKAWTGYLSLPLLLFLLLMLPYNLFLWLDHSAGVDGRQKEEIQVSRLRLLRLISGGLVVLAGLATLFVLAMIYRPLAAANLGGVLTVASFFAAALALGGVMTAMWLGHWYLVTPALSERPLLFATTLVLLGVLIQIVFAFSAGPGIIPAQASQAVTPGVTATATTTIPAATPAVHATTKPASLPLTKAMISSGVASKPFRRTTKPLGTSPASSSGIPMTAESIMAGCSRSRDSSSAGAMPKPLYLIISFFRSTM